MFWQTRGAQPFLPTSPREDLAIQWSTGGCMVVAAAGRRYQRGWPRWRRNWRAAARWGGSVVRARGPTANIFFLSRECCHQRIARLCTHTSVCTNGVGMCPQLPHHVSKPPTTCKAEIILEAGCRQTSGPMASAKQNSTDVTTTLFRLRHPDCQDLATTTPQTQPLVSQDFGKFRRFSSARVLTQAIISDPFLPKGLTR
jgi:hypothetical protein